MIQHAGPRFSDITRVPGAPAPVPNVKAPKGVMLTPVQQAIAAAREAKMRLMTEPKFNG